MRLSSRAFVVITFCIGVLLSATNAVARTIYIAGDSTASEYGLEVFPRMGWGQVLSHFYTDINVVNLAQSGRSAKSYIDEGFFDELAASIGSGDLLLIQFGHNDQKIDSPERYADAGTDYKSLLMRYVELAREHAATPVLITSVARRRFDNGQVVATHGDYPQAVRDLAAEHHIALIDLNTQSRELLSHYGEADSKRLYLHLQDLHTQNLILQRNGGLKSDDQSDLQFALNDEPTVDDSHFSEYGAYRVAALVARELAALDLAELSQFARLSGFAEPAPLSNDAKQQATIFIRVEQDGSGDVTRISDALSRLNDSQAPAIILIGEGVFEEQLMLTRDNVTLVGKGRDKTTIRTSLLRANWRQDHFDDWGASTINIKANDITFMQLRVVNDYGLITGDHSHQFALRLLEGTRIITEDSTFITGGADTVSLWNKDSGMYYHRRGYFEGYTDFVCPRGWSYITDSQFFSRGGAAAIWHDGQRQESQKLVVKRSTFDGVQNFILGRRHYDAQFYLIDNHYSANLSDTPIFRVTYEDQAKNRPNLWGDRAYFYGSHKQGEPYAWLADNISESAASISAKQTFDGHWDPEQKLAHLKVVMALHDVSVLPLQARTSPAAKGGNAFEPEISAVTLANQHIERFPEPWLMRKSDGEYVWSYTHGLVLLGMQRLAEQTGDTHYNDYIKAYADHFIDEQGAITSLKLSEFNIDSVNAGNILFELYQTSGDERYKHAMDQLMLQLKWQPRTRSGGFWHKRKYPWQIWLDGLYMAQPFYAHYQREFGGEPNRSYDNAQQDVSYQDPVYQDPVYQDPVYQDIVKQFVEIEQQTRDADTGLLYHAWDESRLQPWADPVTGRSPGFWSRAMGWYAMALVDTVEHLPHNHAGRKQLGDILNRLAQAITPYQHASGMWYQVPDQGQRAGNWLEASGSSMFVYAIAKGVRLGLLDASYTDVANRGYQGLLTHIISTDQQGKVHVNDVCRSAGLGGEPYRSGTFEYYVSTDRVSDDAHGIGAFLLASAEILRAKKTAIKPL
ncbi:pectinesterase family protein [Arenicella xantha]|uniref:Rhamnogalacturonyl hydrolase YesR n=1 Tax=Arenicella xantha TaxID=644221 RepID=A0A395JMW1_9GAMM|nr:pectinesterase family protein [Arenicella xantha]RBP53004.1 rhamnogalacturonyl hydrolase YesR [Arenicella xantha]